MGRQVKEKKMPEILTEEEQRALLSQPNQKTRTGLRNLCILRLMLDTGLRLSEVTGLKPEDVDLSEGKLIISQDKPERNRVLFIGEENCKLLLKWNEIRPPSQYFFSTLQGSKIDDRYVREMVKRIARKAGIKKNIYPHTLRHTFAADLYRKTKDIRIVQKALGHKNPSSTVVYTYLINEEIDEALRSFAWERESEKKGEEILFPKSKKSLEKPLVVEKGKENEKEKEREKRVLMMHTIKCKCGDILSRNMKQCPGCGKNLETLLEELKNDFYRVNFETKA